MNNPIVLKSISIIAFVISALFTILLMTSSTVTIFAWILTVGMAIILELCKVGFLYEALSNSKLNIFLRLTLATIAILLVGTSIFASSAYVQNQANKTQNIQTKLSSQYKQLEAGKVLQQDLYNVKKKEIDDLKVLQEKQQKNGDSIVNSMPSNYIDRKNQAKADTASQIAKTRDIINSKSTELSQIGASLQIPIDTTNLKINDENGYISMFKTIADMINDNEGYKDNPVKPEQLELWFFVGLSIIFELTATLTAYLSQLKTVRPIITPSVQYDNNITNDNINTTKSTNSNNVIDLHKHDNIKHVDAPRLYDGENIINDNIKDNNTKVIGFKIDSVKPDMSVGSVQTTTYFTNEDIKIYWDYVVANAIGNVSPGYIKISNSTGLQLEKLEKLKVIVKILGH